MEQKRYSRQRELIYNCLRETDSHPTAEMIFQALKPEHPKLSLGTVYRNLNQMADSGLISRLPFHVERYDANISPHAHLCCERCERVFDLDMPEGPGLDAISAACGFSIRSETRYYFGLCRDCMDGAGPDM